MSVPNSREVQEFQFKLLTRLRVFSDSNQLQFDGNLNLIAAASRYGLVFVGTPTGFNIIKVADIVELQANVKKKPSEFCDYSSRRVNLGTQPSHLDVSCDCQLLAVSFILNGAPQIRVYGVASFTSQEIAVVKEVRCDSRVTCMSWNPAAPGMLAVCLASGVAVVYEFSNVSVNINTASDANATCLCWSPKGKQVVIGSSKGTLSQYKPDLKIVKTFAQPHYCSNPVSVISVQWLSNFQFLAVYRDTVDSSERPGVVIVNAPKTGPVTYLNYDDICYSSGTLRDPQFYVIHQQTWNVIMVASGNSMEVGVLGFENDSWVQWIQEDAARADLPLSSSKQETYVVGMAFDTSVQYNLPYGESQILPPMPLLILLSHEGLLCFFFAVNILPSSAVICSPPEPLSDMSGVQCFVPYSEPEAVEDVHAEITVVKPVITSHPPSWLTPPQSVQNNQQKVWSTMTPVTVPIWMTPTSTSLSQPQLTTMQSAYQKSENENPSAAQVSPAAMWTSSAIFAQHSVIQQQLVTGIGGQGLIAAVSTGTKESTGTLSPQITLNVKAQQSPKLMTSRPETETKISDILEPVAIEDSSEDETSKFSEGVIEATIVDTVKHFNSDLAELAEGVKNINSHIGTPEEKLRFQQSFDNMESFLKELTETTTAQKSEVKSLKNLLFDLFAWIEDARSRVQQLSEHSYMISTQLDPVSARKMNNIEHLLFYTNSQLSQINSYLEANWEETQDIQRAKTSHELKTPWMESVFQALTLQNTIISKYSLTLDEIEKKVDECRNITQLPLMSKLSLESDEYTGDNELSKLAESFLGIKLARTGIIPESEQSPINHHIKSVNINKLQKIQELLINQPVTKVQPAKSFMATNVDNQDKESLPGLSLPVTGAKLGGISSGQPVVTTVSKEVTVLHDSKSVFAPTKGSDVSKKTQSSLKNMFDVAQSSKGFSDSVAKTKVAQTYQDVSQFGTATKDSGDVTSVEGKTVDSIPESRFQFTVINPGNNDYVQPVALTQNSPLATLSNIVSVIPDAQYTVSEGKTIVIKDSKAVLNSDAVAVKNIFAGGTTSKPTFGKELDQGKSDLTLLTGSPKITFGISSPSQDFFKNTTASPEMSKNIFSSSLSPFKTVFGGAPSSSEIPGLPVSKSSTDIKAPKTIPATTANTKNAFVFPELKQIVSTESASTDVNTGMAKNIFPTKTTIDIPKSALSQPTTGSGENVKIITPVETSKSVFSITGSTTKNIFSAPAEFNVVLGDQSSVKSSIGSEAGAVKSLFGSKPAVEPPKLIFSTSAAANLTPLNTESSETSKTTFTSTTGFTKTVSTTTVTSTLGGFVVTKSNAASDTETDNKFVSSVPVSSSSIQEEVENFVEEKYPIKDETESIERSENKQNTISQDTSLSLFDNLRLEQTASSKTGSFGGELPSDSQTENKTNFQNQNISPVKTTSGPPPSSTSSFSPLLAVQNTSLSNTTSSPSTETVSSPVLKAETKTVSGTSDIFSKPVSPVSSTMAEKPTTTQAANTFSFSLPDATSGVTQPSFTFSLPANSSDKAVTSTFHFAQPNTTVASNITPSSSTFSFGQLASTVTTAVAGDENTKITLSFGNPQSTASTSASMFSGFTTPQTVAQSNLFGQSVSTTSTTNTISETCFSFSVSTTSPPQNSFFGGKTNLFGAPTTTSASNMFGQSMSSPASTANSLFGQSTPSVFGQATSPASPFGSSSAFNTKPTFGQSGGSLFGQSSSGGFNTSGTSIFGGSSVFGSSGNTSGNLFQTTGTGSIFGGGSTSPGGSFSSGGQTISQAGFGSPAFQNKPAGTFGGAPTFGSAPSFGGAPTFGGSPTFGSPNKAFGSTVPGSGFGPTQQSTTFENLANQNTMTFGNLAQASSGSAFGGSVFGGSSQQPQPSAFSSGSTSFGGSSFSSWR